MSNKTPRTWYVDGVSYLGKTSLANNLMDELGYFTKIDYMGPKHLNYYAKNKEIVAPNEYMFATKHHRQVFEMVEGGYRLMLDGGHLKEVAYAPKYFEYSGDYIFDLERQYDTSNMRMVLLIDSSWSEDPDCLDYFRREGEQLDFLKAFEKSSIEDKVIKCNMIAVICRF